VSANLLKVVRQKKFLIIIGVAVLSGILVLGCRLAAKPLYGKEIYNAKINITVISFKFYHLWMCNTPDDNGSE